MNLEALAIDFGMEEDELLELVKLFIETSLSDLDRIQSAIDEGDAQKVAMAAHSIKGAASNLGLTEIFEIAKTMDLNARENNLDGAPGEAEAIKEKLDGLTEGLSRSNVTGDAEPQSY
jgi:HPt (histidine-containing phosphotransfer) domain-containing protein